MEVMKRGHRRWAEFLARLDGPEGCDFQVREPGTPATTTFNCDGGRNKPRTTAVLKRMGDLDVPASLLYFERHGGFCDCQVVLNVPYD